MANTPKEFQGRIINKHDKEINWNKATSFKPLKGEIIIYDPDENYNYPRVKIGDGDKIVTDPELQFLPYEESIDIKITDAIANLDKVDEAIDYYYVDKIDQIDGIISPHKTTFPKMFHVGTTPPENTNLLWIDTSIEGNILAFYDGSQWSYISGNIWV